MARFLLFFFVLFREFVAIEELAEINYLGVEFVVVGIVVLVLDDNSLLFKVDLVISQWIHIQLEKLNFMNFFSQFTFELKIVEKRVGDKHAPEHEKYAKTYFAHQVAAQLPHEAFANAATAWQEVESESFMKEVLDAAEKHEYDICYGYFWEGDKLVSQLDMRKYRLPCDDELSKIELKRILRFVNVPCYLKATLDRSFFNTNGEASYLGISFKDLREHKEVYDETSERWREKTFDEKAWHTVAMLRKACLELKRAKLTRSR